MKQRDLAQHQAELGFTPRPSVRWLVPSELARSAVLAIVAKVFADYADKREMQGMLPQEALAVDPENYEPGTSDRDRAIGDTGGAGDLWIDFVADLGDGFDATYTVASLLAQPALEVSAPGGRSVTLPRARLLVMGGDEVYPIASSAAYEDRTTGPYAAALPPGFAEATLLALPGNHDWYDGLTSFLRTFTHGRAIGSWRTIQRRSYFAVKLRPGWWMVGLDSQLGEYIDQPQLDYFHRTISTQLEPGDAIILCAASPSWERSVADPDLFNTLHFFERNYLRNRLVEGTDELVPTGASVRLWISGDRHHYARFEEIPAGQSSAASGPREDGVPSSPDPRSTQLITCGLGGAYLMGTDDVPPEVALPSAASRMRAKDPSAVGFRRGPVLYPEPRDGRRLCWQLANPLSKYWLPTRNPWFLFTMGALHLIAVIFLSWSLSVFTSAPIAEAVRMADWVTVLGTGAFVLGLPLALVAGNLLVGAIARGRWRPADTTGVVGVGLQLLISFALFALVTGVRWPQDPTIMLVLAIVITAVAGAVLGSEVFALFVILTSLGPVGNLRMTGLAYEGGKGFVRMRLRPDGDLEVFPLVVDQVCTDWEIDRSNPARVRPVPAGRLPGMRLIEDPIRIARIPYPR